MPDAAVPVLYVCGFSDVAGGGQRSLLLLLGNLDRSRFRPILLLPGPGEMSEAAARLKVEVCHESYPPLRSWRLWRPFLFILRLAGLLRVRGVRIVHSDMPDLALMAACAARLTGIRSVFHARVSEDYRFDGLLYLLHSAIVAVSATAARRFSSFGGSWVFVVRNGVDLSLFKPAQGTGEAPVLGYAGQLVREKGLATILRAFALVLREIPHARLMIVGRGPQEPEMRRLADELAIASQVVFAGFSQNPQDIIRTFDILLFPSRFEEGLSRVLIEAMACGVPAIASAHGSNPEVVTDGMDGFIIESDDPESYAQKALFLLKNDKLRAEFAARAQKRAAARFDILETSRRMALVYDDLLRDVPREGMIRMAYFTVRHAGLAALSLCLPKRRSPMPLAVKKILVIRTDRLGDLVLSLPFLRGLRRAYPQARISLLCQPAWAGLAAEACVVDDIVPWNGFSLKTLARLRAEFFDLAIDAVRDSDLSTAILCRASGARFCAGFESKGRGLLLDQAVSVAGYGHFTQELAQLADALGAEVGPQEIPLHLSKSRIDAAWTRLSAFGIRRGDNILFLHPGGHYRTQRWPAERFAGAAMAARRALGCKVIAAAGPTEAAQLATIKASGAADAVFSGLEIMDLASLMGISTVFAGNNSGPLHLACALGVASVSTLGPSDAARWRPLGKRCAVLRASDFGPGDDVALIPEYAFTAAVCGTLKDS